MIKTESTIHLIIQVAERPGTVKRFQKIGKDLYHKGILVVTEAGSRYYVLNNANHADDAADDDDDDADDAHKKKPERVEEVDNPVRAVVENACPCDSYFKFGDCIHLAVILEFHQLGNMRRMVNRIFQRPTGSRRGGYRERAGWRLFTCLWCFTTVIPPD
jgi:hypothetical protein